MKNLEIERKFLVVPDRWKALVLPPGIPIVQGYLCSGDRKVVRIRVSGDQGFITIKGIPSAGGRPEFEYEIPVAEARDLMKMTEGFPVEKVRYRIGHEGKTWEVDIFQGLNEGLILAEIELSELGEIVVNPEWIGEEVTQNYRYYNAYLSKYPYITWKNNTHKE